MDKKTKQKIADLEECLAGFIICGALQGSYVPPEMAKWCTKQLTGKTRTPMQVWRDVTGITL